MPRLGKFIKYRFPVNIQHIVKQFYIRIFIISCQSTSVQPSDIELRKSTEMMFHGSCKVRLAICGLLLLGRLYVS